MTTERPSPRAWAAVATLTLGIFTIVTTEILPVGLLTPIGASFTVSDGAAGLMMTMPGLLAAVAAPTISAATARLDRRRLLASFTALLLLANVLAAAAPGYPVMLLSRVLLGIVVGGFWSVGAGLAARLVPPRSVPRATAVIFSAVPLGSVLGVPAGTFVGDVAGWRTAFAVLAALAAVTLAALWALLPPLPPEETTRPAALRVLLGRTGIRSALLVTFLIVLAHFGTYTYLTPFLADVTRLDPSLTPTFLLVYGVAGIAGNFAGGSAVARFPRASFATATGGIAAATLLLPLLGHRPAAVIALLVLWGFAYGAVPVCSQTWFANAAPDAPGAASVLFTASFQATLSAGALTGGVLVDRTSPATVMALGGATALLATLAIAVRPSDLRRIRPRRTATRRIRPCEDHRPRSTLSAHQAPIAQPDRASDF